MYGDWEKDIIIDPEVSRFASMIDVIGGDFDLEYGTYS